MRYALYCHVAVSHCEVQFIIFKSKETVISSNKIYLYTAPVGNGRKVVIVKIYYRNICCFVFSSMGLEVFAESHVFDNKAVNIRVRFGTSCCK